MSVAVAAAPGTGFSFSIDGIDDVKIGIDEAGALVSHFLANALSDIAKDILTQAQGRITNRSGNLSQSAALEIPTETLDEISLYLGFQAGYAAFRDQGGTIVPTRADVLAIPQAPILDGNGTSLYANPRQEPTLFVFRFIGQDGQQKAGLAMKVNGKLEIHWIFADSVTQQGSKYFSSTISERAPHVGALAAVLVKDDLSGWSG